MNKDQKPDDLRQYRRYGLTHLQLMLVLGLFSVIVFLVLFYIFV